VLDRLLENVRGGESAALVIRGEAGVGKTALLRYAARQASGFRVAQIAGVESEMELPYAALHQLCAPMLVQLDALPDPQGAALRVAFGLSSGDPPDRFLVALAALSLLAQIAEDRPLLCLVDDGQWLDGASGQVLGFVARRLQAESVTMVFAVRELADDRPFAGLPELMLAGLAPDDARAVLATVVPGRLDERVRDRIVAETRGNPLALLELPRGMSAAELAGGFAVLDGGDLRGHIEDHYSKRLDGLPEATRRLMLLAAADPVGDASLVWRAAQTLGIDLDAAAPAATEQLLDIGAGVRFRHPLVRSAVYRGSSASERQAAHGALAIATDPEIDPDRRAWHQAQAASAPNEQIAADLERSAGRAQARGGLAAAAAFLERAAELTVDPTRRADRMLAAAQCHLQAGAFDDALGLLAAAESTPMDDFGHARADLLKGLIAAGTSPRTAPLELLKAAKRLEPLALELARQTYLDAWGAALFAGRLAGPGGSVHDVSEAARAAPRSVASAGPSDLLLDGLAALVTEGRLAAAPLLRPAVSLFGGDEVSAEQWLRWGVLASSAAVTLWDFESWEAVSTRQIEVARAAGALTPLSVALNGQAMIATWRGELEEAAALSAEDEVLKDATGVQISPYGAMLLAAYQGRMPEATVLADATIKDAIARGEGLGVQLAQWTIAVLQNGLGQYEDALEAAEQATDERGLFISTWALAELIEAAVRCGRPDRAADALARLIVATSISDADWALATQVRARALLAEGDVAEDLYREAIERLSRTPLRTELARAHLLYGEWLRRENRRVDGREQLRVAHDIFAAMGADGFAERARHELLATGEQVRKRRDDTRDDLTPQEEHIARLARDGRTNPEIGAELFISARTVEWHLRKVFTKLGITSRRGLHDALPSRDANTAPR
jgi:DNA-binding CsgD family transcriptional regulator/tetratricopeptide (TPR) repeat protein